LALAAWCGAAGTMGWTGFRHAAVAADWDAWGYPNYWPASMKDATVAGGWDR
jgi:hypothetical protein